MTENVELEISDSSNLNNLTEENKHYNEISTTDEIQNIFKKIKKKKYGENKLSLNDYKNDESNYALTNNNQNKTFSLKNFDSFQIFLIILNIISFILFYFSFYPIIEYYYYPVNIFIFPMELIQFLFCFFSSGITAFIIALIILKKFPFFHLLYMFFYFISIFFFHHYKYIGNSRFDQSLSVFHTFIIILFDILCILFLLYFFLKYQYYRGKIKKNNYFIGLFITRWNSLERIKRNENNALLNDKNLIFSYPKNKGKKLRIICFLLFISIFFIFNCCMIHLKKKKLFLCENLDIGINGTHILNKKTQTQCQIKKPEGYCYMDYFKYYFDLTPIDNSNCSLRDPIEEKKNFFINLEGINNDINYYNAKIFAFPHTNLDSKYFLKNQKDINDFGTLVNKDIYDIEDEKNKEKKKLEPEIILDFSDNNIYQGKFPELKINLIYNKTLSEERKKLESINSLYDNIFMIYVDATSRAHFQRSFPKLSNLLKNFMKYDDTNLKKIDAFQFMKYSSFAPATHYNIIPMFYGNSYQSKKGVNHIKYFKENGYITGHEVDMCNKEQYDISLDPEDKREYIEWDHENIAYLCDGNYFEIDNPYPKDKGAFYHKERCLYGHPVSYYMIEYAKQFWLKYENNKKYFRMAFNYGHEKTGAVISKLDEPLYDFLFEFYDKGYFDNTAVFIVSDHGNQNKGIYNIINKNQFEYEQKMCTFFLLLPKNKNINNFIENLYNNQQVFLTPYDIHDTMLHIIEGKGDLNKLKEIFSANNKGNSVFLEINENERNCDKYDDWIEKSFCICLEK